MKKILIAGEPGKTGNYENALGRVGVCVETGLHVPDTTVYDGLLLPGGGDIDPRLFGQLPAGTRFFDPELDRVQLHILDAFVTERKPVLGICKGMQLINIYFGGDLIQHLPTAGVHEYVGRDQLHETTARKDSFLGKLYGERFVVNSAHHQGADKIPPALSLAAQAEDGVPEALQCPEKGIYAVQWHPERMMLSRRRADAVDGTLVFRFFAGLL